LFESQPLFARLVGLGLVDVSVDQILQLAIKEPVCAGLVFSDGPFNSLPLLFRPPPFFRVHLQRFLAESLDEILTSSMPPRRLLTCSRPIQGHFSLYSLVGT
jgi:hypothetical protein